MTNSLQFLEGLGGSWDFNQKLLSQIRCQLAKSVLKYFNEVLSGYISKKYFIRLADNILTIGDQSGKLSKCSNLEEFTFKLWIAPP